MKYFITIIFCFATLSILAQKTYVKPDSEIKMHHAIDSLRKDFSERIKLKDNGIINTLNTQIIQINKDTVQVFFPEERAIALYLVHDFPSLLNDVVEKYDFHYFLRSKYFKRKKTKFSRFLTYQEAEGLLMDLNHEKEKIILTINQSELTNDEKDFLQLYLTSILSYVDLRSFDAEQIIKDAESFLEKYPNSKYSEYVDKVLYIKFETMDFGMGVGLFSGYNVVRGNISDYFKNYIPIGVNMELGYKWVLLKGDVSPSVSQHLKKPFDYKNNTWPTDSTPIIIDLSLNLGFALVDRSKYKLTPYIGTASHGINLGTDIDNMLFNSSMNIGIDLDWKFANYNSYLNYSEALASVKDNTYWHLRLRIGYNQFKNDDERFNGSLIYTKIEIGFYSNPAKRVKKK